MPTITTIQNTREMKLSPGLVAPALAINPATSTSDHADPVDDGELELALEDARQQEREPQEHQGVRCGDRRRGGRGRAFVPGSREEACHQQEYAGLLGAEHGEHADEAGHTHRGEGENRAVAGGHEHQHGCQQPGTDEDPRCLSAGDDTHTGACGGSAGHGEPSLSEAGATRADGQHSRTAGPCLRGVSAQLRMWAGRAGPGPSWGRRWPCRARVRARRERASSGSAAPPDGVRRRGGARRRRRCG